MVLPDIRPVPNFDAFAELFPSLRPHEHPVIVVNTARGSVDRFRARVAGAKGGAFDFDGSVHRDVQWRLFLELLDAAARASNATELERYHRRQRHHNAKDIRFGLLEAGRLKGIKRKDLFALVAKMPPRPGALDLLRSFRPEDTAFISFGVRDIIQHWIWHYMCHAEWNDPRVFALALRWAHEESDWHCEVAGYDAASIITNGNKGYAASIFRVERNLRPSETLVLVDSPSDLLMMDRWSVNVLLLPKAPDASEGRSSYRERGLRQLWARADAVLVSDSLEPLVELRRAR